MVTKFSTVAILVLISMATIFSTCKKHFGCADNVYSFQIGVRAYPDKDSIPVGDTIWFEVNTPTTFEEARAGSFVNYNNAENIGSTINIIEFPKKDSVRDAVNDFNYIFKKGIHVNNPLINKIRECLFVEENNRYLFKLGIIPQKRELLGLPNYYHYGNLLLYLSYSIPVLLLNIVQKQAGNIRRY